MSKQKYLLSPFIVLSLTLLNLPVKATDSSAVLGQIAQQPRLPSARVRDAWKPVYQNIPGLPLENKYVNRDGQVDADNTLVDRLIRYHVYVKGRSQNYRLDWKLTLADYLGANEVMQEKAYPGADSLSQNPLNGDRAAIARLNRKQRDALVQSLVNIFNPNSSAADTQIPQPSTTNSESRPSLPQPKPGDAQLLK